MHVSKSCSAFATLRMSVINKSDVLKTYAISNNRHSDINVQLPSKINASIKHLTCGKLSF